MELEIGAVVPVLDGDFPDAGGSEEYLVRWIFKLVLHGWRKPQRACDCQMRICVSRSAHSAGCEQIQYFVGECGAEIIWNNELAIGLAQHPTRGLWRQGDEPCPEPCDEPCAARAMAISSPAAA